MKCYILIVGDIRNFAFGLDKVSVYGFGQTRKQKFIMSFTIVIEQAECMTGTGGQASPEITG